jgi:hypothetical protein
MRWSEFRRNLPPEDRSHLMTFLLSGFEAVRLAAQATHRDDDVEELRFQLTAAIESLTEARRMLPEV